MRALAEYLMQGRRQALLVAVVCAALPMMFWLSAATVSLVTLRRGYREGVKIVVWALLPTLAWWAMGDPTPLMSLLGTFILAWVLRATVSWPLVLLVSTLIGLLLSGVLPMALQALVSQLQTLSDSWLASVVDGPVPSDARHWLMQLLIGALAAFQCAINLGSVMMARAWQADLYNPGGFRAEFHQLRLPAWLALALGFVLMLGAGAGPEWLRWLPVLSLPLVVAGLALVHGVIGIKALGKAWLGALYVALLLLGPYVYPLLMLLGVIDSLVNIRRRLNPMV
ncbi:hypothetical protein C4K68_26035 [Pokkaliibacter plantistimulans]|uniref:DUF2232 domain-containing protein n=1 Tax=Proteobacteria bacterium 228 TaxID=2083153 RepID=A0A2S5KHY3_9PROT|nr:hypothetical protein C4K68_26035 [Pokkaliibacter plantistimulans]